jgi:hypothetical protein
MMQWACQLRANEIVRSISGDIGSTGKILPVSGRTLPVACRPATGE